jgi:subtilisin
MTRLRGLHLGAALLLVGALTLVAPSSDAAEPPRGVPRASAADVPDQFIVVLDDQIEQIQAVDAVARDIAARARGQLRHVYRAAFKGFAIRLSPGIDPDQLARDPRVAFVQRDRVVRHTDHLASELPTGVNRVNAELNRTTGAVNPRTGAPTGLGIAVVDTGIQLTHPDLNVAGHVSFVRGVRSGNDDNGHGTHVAGIIGARDNRAGVVGVAPGVPLYAVKVLDRYGSGLLSDVAKGVDWVTQNRSRIAAANLSLGAFFGTAVEDRNCGNTVGDALHKAICASVRAGVVYVVAAGNDAEDARYAAPAGYREVVTVSALADSDGRPNGAGPATPYGADDTFASFSNFGAGVDLIAPGVRIRSTCLGSSYCRMTGTSQAAPHATGAVALWVSANGRPAVANASDTLFRDGILRGLSSSVGLFRDDPDGRAERMVNADTRQVGGTGSSVCCPAR